MPFAIPTYFAMRFVSTRKLSDRVALIGNSYKAQLLGFLTIGSLCSTTDNKYNYNLLYDENSLLFHYR